MTRTLDKATLEAAARDYAGMWMQPDQQSPGGVFITGPGRVLQDFYNLTFKDEFNHLTEAFRGWLGRSAIADFEARSKGLFTPRDDAVFDALLKEKLAIDRNGSHIKGAVGTTELGSRIVGVRPKIIKTRRFGEIRLLKNEKWPVYAGEMEEREAGSDAVDPLPEGADPWPLIEMHATNPNISAEAALAMLDALTVRVDEGTTAATIRGRTGTQPADPDASETGTLLFTLTMSDPSFGAAADIAPSARITASAITSDSSADATGTLTYCRVGATGTGVDDHIDGSAGTSAADFVFNTVSIVSGAAVSMSSFTVTLPQGATAT